MNVMRKTTVLIADDEPTYRRSLKKLLSLMEEVELIAEATSGKEAISLAKKFIPDLILMDINMEPVNGFEATREIVLINPSTKVIGLSLHNEYAYARKIMEFGAKGYVCKSSYYNDILKAIRTVISGDTFIDNSLRG